MPWPACEPPCSERPARSPDPSWPVAWASGSPTRCRLAWPGPSSRWPHARNGQRCCAHSTARRSSVSCTDADARPCRRGRLRPVDTLLEALAQDLLQRHRLAVAAARAQDQRRVPGRALGADDPAPPARLDRHHVELAIRADAYAVVSAQVPADDVGAVPAVPVVAAGHQVLGRQVRGARSLDELADHHAGPLRLRGAVLLERLGLAVRAIASPRLPVRVFRRRTGLGHRGCDVEWSGTSAAAFSPTSVSAAFSVPAAFSVASAALAAVSFSSAGAAQSV